MTSNRKMSEPDFEFGDAVPHLLSIIFKASNQLALSTREVKDNGHW
jgi:hypothetical protein